MYQPYLFPEYEHPLDMPPPPWRHTPASARKTWQLLQRWQNLYLTITEKHILLALACGESTPKTIARYTGTASTTVASNLRHLTKQSTYYNSATDRIETIAPLVRKNADRTWSLTDNGRHLVDLIIYP